MTDMLLDMLRLVLSFNILSFLPNVAASVILAMKYGSRLSTGSIGAPFLAYAASYVAASLILGIVISPYLLLVYIFAGPMLGGIGFLLHLSVVSLSNKQK